MTTTYKYLTPSIIQWHRQIDSESYESGLIKQGQTRTRTDENGEEETYNPWDELIASGVSIEPIDIEPIRQNALTEINRQRDQRIHGGITFNGHTYQTDPQSITDVMGAILAQAPTAWLTADNQTVQMSVTDLQQFGQAIAAHKQSLVYQARTHKDNVLALNTASEIESYLENITWS